MAVRFEFTLSDEEAETLFDIVSDRIFQAVERSNDHFSESEDNRKWWKGHAQYLHDLKAKMSNSRVTP